MEEAVSRSLTFRSDASQAFAAAGVPPEWADKAMFLATLEVAERESLTAKQASGCFDSIPPTCRTGSPPAGSITTSRRIREKLNTLRQQAVEEVKRSNRPRYAASARTGRRGGLVTAWFWSASDAAEQAVDDLRERFASLAAFLESVTRELMGGGRNPNPPSTDRHHLSWGRS